MNKANQYSNILHQAYMIMPNFCDKCGARHAKVDLEMLEQNEEKLVCKLECATCKNTYIFQLNRPVDGNITAKKTLFKSDLSNSDEFKKFSRVEQIDTEEILEVMLALNEVKTISDFNSLLD